MKAARGMAAKAAMAVEVKRMGFTRVRIVLALGLMAGALVAHASDCSGRSGTQRALEDCAAADHKAADAELNRVYRVVQARLKGDPPAARALTAAQRAWLGFRDAECAFRTGSGGGSITAMVQTQCLAELTQARSKALGAYLNCAEGDLACPVPRAR